MVVERVNALEISAAKPPCSASGGRWLVLNHCIRSNGKVNRLYETYTDHTKLTERGEHCSHSVVAVVTVRRTSERSLLAVRSNKF